MARESTTTRHPIGQHPTTEYKTWTVIRSRCLRPDDPRWEDYGGRGIKICDRWINSFETFLADIGRRPPECTSIDRYPNNDGDYEPGNTRWATREMQANNTRTNRPITAFGETLTLTQWSRRTGVKVATIWARLNRGLTPEVALTQEDGRATRWRKT